MRKSVLSMLTVGCVFAMCFSAYADDGKKLKVAYIPNSMSNESKR